MKILVLHGFKSSANNGKYKKIKEKFESDTCGVHTLEYEPHNPIAAERAIRSKFKEFGTDDVVVVGTSMGGFWAKWCAREFPCKALVINPCLNPDEFLSDVPKEVIDFNGNAIHVIQSHLKFFDKYKTSDGFYIVVASTNDEVLGYKDILKWCAEHDREVVLTNENHRFEDYNYLENQLEVLINTYSADMR